MKKITALLLCVILLFSITSCGKSSCITQNGKTTLMIYMIGSDLESGSGSGTDDLIEIQDSGIDLETNNVVVYAGGTTKWENDTTSAENNTILSLNNDGYTVEQEEEQTSMGDPETLTGFLDYSVKNHPAEHFILILWDHGNGPLEGYGKDTLFDNDSLTLAEMSQALEASPFSENSKLDWVGFDACLMSSAELACIWSDYADYYVASQEIEPAFGWDYSFLKDLGKKETTDFLTEITDTYLDSCLAYYEKKNYKDRDTTLAAVDLSLASDMKEALNDLFSSASGHLSDQYDSLAASRVRTRALGRSSTGSEYDLVDLGDLAEQFKKDYPDQAQKLSDVIDEMIVCNTTNTQRLCGMSLYYPFFNKSYYENKWSEEYSEMDIFGSYVEYLSEYGDIWMDEDLMDYASSGKPNAESDNRFTLKLEPEQAEHYASAKYTILKKISGDAYTSVYESPQVSYEDGSLTAEFDGNVIYAHNEVGYYSPVYAEALESAEDVTHYSVRASLNDSQGSDFVTGAWEGEDVENIMPCVFNIAVDNETKEIDTSTLTPYQKDKSGDVLSGGKVEDIDLEQYTSCVFMKGLPSVITRDENGVIESQDNWETLGVFSSFDDFPLTYGVDFLYAPLSSGDYALIFEICDTQGNTYCSEPIDIDTSEYEAPVITYEQRKPKSQSIEVESDGTYPLLLTDGEVTNGITYTEEDGFKLYLDTVVDAYDNTELTLYADNGSDDAMYYTIGDTFCNGNISCESSGGISQHIDAGKEGYPKSIYVDTNDEPMTETFSFSNEINIGAIKDISSLSFKLTVKSDTTKETLRNEDTVTINFKDGAHFEPNTFDWKTPYLEETYEPLFGVTVEPQTIADTDSYRVELLKFGVNYGYLNQIFRITNKSDEVLHIDQGDFAIDNIETNQPINTAKIQPACEYYYSRSTGLEDLENMQITAMQKLSYEFHTVTYTEDFNYQGEHQWFDAKLKNPSETASKFTPGDTELLNKDGYVVSLLKAGPWELYDNGKKWSITVENKADHDTLIKLDLKNVKAFNADGDEIENASILMNTTTLQSGQRSVFILTATSEEESVDSVEFGLIAYNGKQDHIYFRLNDPIKLE